MTHPLFFALYYFVPIAVSKQGAMAKREEGFGCAIKCILIDGRQNKTKEIITTNQSNINST